MRRRVEKVLRPLHQEVSIELRKKFYSAPKKHFLRAPRLFFDEYGKLFSAEVVSTHVYPACREVSIKRINQKTRKRETVATAKMYFDPVENEINIFRLKKRGTKFQCDELGRIIRMVPPARGQMLFRAVLEEAISFARRMKVKNISVETFEPKLKGHYEKFGFVFSERNNYGVSTGILSIS